MSSKNKPGKKGTIRRRQLLKMLGLGGLAISSEKALSQIKIGRVLAPNKDIEIKGGQAADLVIKLLRPQDLLSLELHFLNFSLSGNQLIKKGDPALMKVKFQPQSIAESCGTETMVSNNDTLTLPDLPAKMIISNDSRLVFRINKNLTLDVKDLLAWENFELVVNERAKPVPGLFKLKPIEINKNIDKILNGVTTPVQISNTKGISKDEKLYIKQQLFQTDEKPKNNILANISSGFTQLMNDPVGPPGDWETSLEIPLRLFVSPTKNAGWKHSIKLNPANGILKETNRLFELWHTRMGTKTSKGIDESDLSFEERVLRVLWGTNINKEFNNIPDCTTGKLTDPFLGNTSMNDFYRHQIVHESSNFLIPGFAPQPVRAYKLFLTTLGGYLDSIFLVDRKKIEAISGKPVTEATTGSKNLSLLKWRHIQTLAREHYVELVLAGNIMPFGHEAVLITITERKPHKPSATATNFKKQIVVITEPVKDYNYRDSSNMFMNFCFHSVEMLTTASPLLDTNKKKLVDPSGMSSEEQFIIQSDGKDVQFKIRGEDLNGNSVNFSMPIVFVSSTVLGNASNINTLAETYNKGVFVDNNSDFKGQKISLAPLDKSGNGIDTAFAGYEVNFGIQTYNSPDEVQGFLPKMGILKIIEPSYKRLTGLGQTVPVSLVSDENAGHVFAKFEFSAPVNFGGNADKTGGFALPNFNLSGLSKAAGAFGGDIEKFKTGTAAATDYFNVTGMPAPVLFGVFKLSDILDFVAGDTNGYDLSKPLIDRVQSKIPNLTTENTADAVKTSYIIKSRLTIWPPDGDALAKFVQFKPTAGDDAFSIVTQAVSKKDKSGVPSAPSFLVDARMKAFTVSLMAGLINVNFHSLSFTASPGKSADINIAMQKPALDFGGPLSFINAFQKLIPPGGFSDPPYLDVSLTGVVCGYTLALPNLQLGAFTLSHLSMGAEVNLPFTGAPMTIGFRFCEKHQPFTLTVSILGGGGYFGFEADLHGLRQIDAAIEFGAAVSLNLGVASGAASVMAGIYFKMIFTDGQNSTQLTGYLRINGALSILGLITASIELYMALTYLVDKHKAYGEASVSVKVHVLFFSKTVSVHTSRTFAGSGSDPNFKLTYSPAEWALFCNAFAA